MPDPTPDPTLDRLLRHMAWANAALLARLAGGPDTALAQAAPRNEWTAAMILQHLVNAAGGYASRLESVPRPDALPLPGTVTELALLASACADYDARLRAQATAPDAMVAAGNPERPPRARSTVLAQAIHHATEHRAQIAGALATNGNNSIDLDALDLWEYGDAEGLGA